MKTQLKKLVKSAMLGVAVLGGAVAMQSFGEKAPSLVEHQQMRFWGNINGQYQELSSVNPALNCSSGSTEQCVLQSTDASIPSQFNYSEREDFENLENHSESSSGIYTP